MKKKLAIAFLGTMLTVILSACATKKNCEAYDGKQSSMNNIENEKIPC